MTLQDLHNHLDRIAQLNSSNQSVNQEFQRLLELCGPTEIKWVIRIILKKLSIGLKGIWQTYHPDADHLYDENSDLRTVCDTLQDRNKKIQKNISNITVLKPFKPMLLERLEILDTGKFFEGNNDGIIVQTKFDGERSQLHMKNGKFKYFTRNGTDITNNTAYGESKSSSGFLTKRIIPLFNPNCQSIILDGELMGWHKEKKIFGTKGVAFDVKKLTERSALQPCFIAYDIIHYNGEFLLNKSFKERVKILEEAFRDSEGLMIKCENTKVTDVDELLQIFNDSLAKKEEGIVLRDPNETYKPNTREGSGCYKVKAEYSSDLIQDIDLVIVGGYHGQKKYAGMCGSFLLAVLDKSENKFYSVVSVSSGLDDVTRKNLSNTLKWTNYRPDCIEGPKKDLPDLWVHPENSIALQLRASEIIKCPHQPTNYTFRFPRVEKIRDDKPSTDVCSLEELKALVLGGGYVQKLTKRFVSKKDISDKSGPPAKKMRECGNTRKVNGSFQGIDSSRVTQITQLFEGKEFCVMHCQLDALGRNKLTKQDFETIISQHSGHISQNATKNTFCVIGRKTPTVTATTLIETKKYDIVKEEWLLRATKEENWKSMVDFKPWECIALKKSTHNRVYDDYDHYYDSYTEKVDIDGLKKPLNRITELANDPNDKILQNLQTEFTNDDYDNLTKEMFGTVSPFSLFVDIVGYFANPFDLKKHLFIFMNGICNDEIDENITHIFINEKSINMIDLYKQTNNLKKNIKIVNSQWIKDCFDNSKILSEKSYVIT